MFIECEKCEFNVRENAEYCPDCGADLFAETQEDFDRKIIAMNRGLWLILTVILGTLLSVLIIFFRSDGTYEGFFKVESIGSAVFIGVLLGTLFGFLLMLLISSFVEEKEKFKEREIKEARKDTLAHKQEEIMDLLVELEEKENSIERLYSETEDYVEKRKLEKMLDIIELQTELCHLQENRIELARLENEFLPLTDPANLNRKDIAEGIESEEYFREGFGEFRKGFKHIEKEKEFEKILPEYEKFKAEIEEVNERWNKTLENLKSNQELQVFENKTLSTNLQSQDNLTDKLRNKNSLVPTVFHKLDTEYARLDKNI